MRLFIAIDLPLQVKDVVSRFEKELSMFKLRFVKPEHMHITLTFLGDIEDVDAIKQRLGKIRFSPFKLKIYAYGFFPSTKKIRVIWIGLEHNEEFINLQHDIRELFDNKEKFMPHITIARAREIIIREAEQLNYATKKISYEPIEFVVDKFVLYNSDLTPQGPIHTILEEYDAVALHV